MLTSLMRPPRPEEVRFAYGLELTADRHTGRSAGPVLHLAEETHAANAAHNRFPGLASAFLVRIYSVGAFMPLLIFK